MFSDLPSHLVNLSLEGSAGGPNNGNNGSGAGGNNGRHYQARDFTDSDFKASRDAMAANSNALFDDLDPLK